MLKHTRSVSGAGCRSVVPGGGAGGGGGGGRRGGGGAGGGVDEEKVGVEDPARV